MARQVGLPDRLEDAHAVAASLLDPILDGSVTSRSWDPVTATWR